MNADFGEPSDMESQADPDKAAEAIKLAIDSPLEFWYEPSEER